MEITLQNLADVKISGGLRQNVLDNVNACLPQFSVTSFLRIAHFMAQVCHESGGFTVKTENMNYTSPQRLMEVWPKRFTTLEIAQQFVSNPQKLANNVYANRMGNGGPETNDGFNYRGRGPMQTTGKAAYRKMSLKIFNDDRLLGNPDMLADLSVGIKAAFIEWNENNCNVLADEDDIRKITLLINGGTIGLDGRQKWLTDWKHTLTNNPS
jgi:putative chitinase